MKTNKGLLLSLVLLLLNISVYAQVGIGTNTPAASAALEVSSSTNNKGILIPRITATQKDAISNPAEGLMVYQTSAPVGFYFYTGNSWILLVSQTDLDLKVAKVSGKDLSSNDYTSAEKTKVSNLSGTNTGDQTNITGNAATATKLETARSINGVAFDGSADIIIAADAGTLSGSVAIVNGGTGSTTKSFVDLTTLQTIAGDKIFSSDITVNGVKIGRGLNSIASNTQLGYDALKSNTTGANNIAAGYEALKANTDGYSNAAFGGSALTSNTIGFYNTALGKDALRTNISGSENTGVGLSSLYSNNGGSYNTALGSSSLDENTSGEYNTAVGRQALSSTTSGSNNVAVGAAALNTNTTGSSNTAIGNTADVATNNLTNATAIGNGANVATSNTIQLGNTAVTSVNTSGTLTTGAITYPNTAGTNGYYLKTDGSGAATWAAVPASGVPYLGATQGVDLGAYDLKVNGLTVGLGPNAISSNTVLGNDVLSANVSGSDNTVIGKSALRSNTTGSYNTATGVNVLYRNTTGNFNTATGRDALFANLTGNYNTANGYASLASNVGGQFNTALGESALFANTEGNYNTATGLYALRSNTTGSNNTALGYNADVASAALTNATAIGNGAVVTTSNTIQLGADGTNGITAVTNVKTSGTLTAGTVTFPNAHNSIAGQVLTTNAAGVASWAAIPAGSGVDLTTNQSVGGLKTFTSIDGLMATGILGQGTASLLGAGTRMMWYPKKSAFRAGEVSGTEWDDTNIGVYSTAMGNSSTARGSASTAMGQSAYATGSSSTAMGEYTYASGNYSTAMGQSTRASGSASTAMGEGTYATGNYSTAMGQSTSADGAVGTAMGYSSRASGEVSTAMGRFTKASGFASTAMGENTTAKSFVETAIGIYNTDYTPTSTYGNQFVSTDRLFVIGNGTYFTKSDALVMLKNGNTAFSGSVTAPSFPTSSDLRLKRNIAPLQNSIAAIMQLKPVSYEKKSTLASTDYSIKENGFIAQELQKIMPNLVIEGTDKDKLLSVNYTAIIPVLTKALQEQQNAIQAQQKQIEELKLLILSMKKQ